MLDLVVVGVSHHRAALDVRARMAFDHERWREVAPTSLATILVSTCNRIEVYAWAPRPASAMRQIERSFARAAGLEVSDVRPHLVRRRGSEALLHLVRLAAGLDSLVVGEEQIRGQVRDALAEAEQVQPLPPLLRGVFQKAAESARRIRAQTSLGSVPSIAAAAVHVAHRTLPRGLAGRSAVVLGAGVMARTATESLLMNGARVTVLNRTPAHARDLLTSLGAEARAGGLDDLPAALNHASLVIGTTASRQPVLSRGTVQEAIARRDGEPLMILDIAVPRDVDPDVRGVSAVSLIDLDDLERECPVDVMTRQSELQRAEALAAREADRLAHWLRLRSASPAIAELRTYGEDVRTTELRRAASRLRDLTPEQIAAVEAVTEGIVNKLLHGPTVALRDAAARPRGLSRSRTRILRMLRPTEGRTA